MVVVRLCVRIVGLFFFCGVWVLFQNGLLLCLSRWLVCVEQERLVVLMKVFQVGLFFGFSLLRNICLVFLWRKVLYSVVLLELVVSLLLNVISWLQVFCVWLCCVFGKVLMVWCSGSVMLGLLNMVCNLVMNSEVWLYCMWIMFWVLWFLLVLVSWVMCLVCFGQYQELDNWVLQLGCMVWWLVVFSQFCCGFWLDGWRIGLVQLFQLQWLFQLGEGSRL